ncbi:MAG: ThiF family adenylyltransferase [bacterium]|nr:ThiF family adenylyltransferase [bacterium]
MFVPIICKDEESYRKLKVENPGLRNLDVFELQLKELFNIRNPNVANKIRFPDGESKFLKSPPVESVWIYFPWKELIVKMVSSDAYFELRTARNKNIISKEEQQSYRNLRIGIAGLSVGSAILENLNISGGPQSVKIADFDRLETTNLNRIRGTLLDIGQLKTEVAAWRAYELDPFLHLETYDSGLDEKNIEKFMMEPKLDAFIDEMDSLEMKYRAREICKKNGIPVLMATEVGDKAVLDVERYDLEPETEPFLGALDGWDFESLKKVDREKWFELTSKIIDRRHLSERMTQSVGEIGRTLAGVPQLGTAASVAGASISLALRKISSGKKLPSGKYVTDLERALENRV